MFQMTPLPSREFSWNIKPYFLWEKKVKKIKCRLLQFLFGALRVNSFYKLATKYRVWRDQYKYSLYDNTSLLFRYIYQEQKTSVNLYFLPWTT